MQPWDFDYQLNPPAIAALARRCGLHGHVTPLGAGWDYATFVCAGTVIRVPKRAATAALLAAENALLRQLPHDLSLHTPRPRDTLATTAGLPYPCMLYPLLAGRPLCEVAADGAAAPVPAAALGNAMGTFLKDIHRLTIANTPDRFGFEAWDAHALGRLAELARWLGSGTLQRATNALLEARRTPAAPLVFSRRDLVFSHKDLGDDHILVSPAGAAVAVIDWGDAGHAPWWFDFTGLWLWGAETTLSAAFDAYGRLPDAAERRCLQHHALLAATNELHYELSRETDSAARQKSLARFTRAIDAAS